MRTKNKIALTIFTATVLLASGAHAVEDPGSMLGITAGARAVISFSQAFSDLGVTPGGEFSVGYILPIWERRLATSLSIGYLWAKAEGSGTDPRLVDQDGTPYDGYSWEMFQHQVIFSLRVKGRIFPLERKFTPYLYVGPALHLLVSTVKAESGGEDFGENKERSTKPGVNGGAGVEYEIGPGRLFGEICISASPLDHKITGDKNTGNLGFGIGYLFLF